jgi:hypothetical protein
MGVRSTELGTGLPVTPQWSIFAINTGRDAEKRLGGPTVSDAVFFVHTMHNILHRDTGTLFLLIQLGCHCERSCLSGRSNLINHHRCGLLHVCEISSSCQGSDKVLSNAPLRKLSMVRISSLFEHSSGLKRERLTVFRNVACSSRISRASSEIARYVSSRICSQVWLMK